MSPYQQRKWVGMHSTICPVCLLNKCSHNHGCCYFWTHIRNKTNLQVDWICAGISIWPIIIPGTVASQNMYTSRSGGVKSTEASQEQKWSYDRHSVVHSFKFGDLMCFQLQQQEAEFPWEGKWIVKAVPNQANTAITNGSTTKVVQLNRLQPRTQPQCSELQHTLPVPKQWADQLLLLPDCQCQKVLTNCFCYVYQTFSVKKCYGYQNYTTLQHAQFCKVEIDPHKTTKLGVKNFL